MATLFQDPSSVNVYDYAQQPLTLLNNSTVAGYLMGGASYDICSNFVGSSDLSLNASRSQYFSYASPATTFPIPSTIADGNGFTFSTWIFPVGAQESSGAVLFDLSGTSIPRRAALYYGSSSNTLATIFNGTGYGISGKINATSVTVTPNTWHHICWTVRCTAADAIGVNYTALQSLYIDGSLCGTDNSVSYSSFVPTSATYGGKPGVTGSYFNGRMNEMRFYGRVLSLPEIGALYNIFNYVGYLKYQGVGDPNGGVLSTIGGSGIPANPSFPFTANSALNTAPVAYIDGSTTSFGVAMQIDVCGSFSFLSVKRVPAFNVSNEFTLFGGQYAAAGQYPTVNTFDGSSVILSAASSTSNTFPLYIRTSSAGITTLIDQTVRPNLNYTYWISPYLVLQPVSLLNPDAIAGINTTNVAANLALNPDISMTPTTITVTAVQDSSYGGFTSTATVGLHGSVVQIDISGVFSYMWVYRTATFDATATVHTYATADSSNVVYNGVSGTQLRMFSASATVVPPSDATVYFLQYGNNVMFVDTTVYPRGSYSYTFSPYIHGNQGYALSTGGSNFAPTISVPTVVLNPVYDASYGVTIGAGIHGSTIQIDLCGNYTSLDISRNPPFLDTEIVGLQANGVLRVYDASASTNVGSLGLPNAYIVNALTSYGVSFETFIDTTTYSGATYSYSIIPWIRDGRGNLLPVSNPLTGGGYTITITSTPSPVNSLPANSPLLPQGSDTVASTPLSSSSLPGISIGGGGGAGASSDLNSGAAAVGGFSGGGGGGSGGSSGSGGGSGGAGSGVSDPAASLATGSAGFVTAVTSTGDPPLTQGISATGGAPSAPSATSPGAVALASGSGTKVVTDPVTGLPVIDPVTGLPQTVSLYSGSEPLPSNVTTYFAAQTTSTGAVSVGQAVTIPTPPAGITSNTGTVSFTAWPGGSGQYDPGTTLTVMINGVPILSNYAFPADMSSSSSPYTTFNIPFTLPANIGSAQVSFVVNNSNGTPNSTICFSPMSMNYSYTPGAGMSAVDVSNLVLYYPFDLSSNVGVRVNDYATPIPVLDASMTQNSGSTAIVSNAAVSIPVINMGSGCFSLGGPDYLSVGAWTMPPPRVGGGFSITGWFCSTVLPIASKSTLCCFGKVGSPYSSISIDISSGGVLEFNVVNKRTSTTQSLALTRYAVGTNLWYFFGFTGKYVSDVSHMEYRYYVNNYMVGDVSSTSLPDTSFAYVSNYLGGVPSAVNTALGLNLSGFSGYMDDFRVYNRPLTSGDMNSLWMYGMGTSATTYLNIVDSTSLIMYNAMSQAALL